MFTLMSFIILGLIGWAANKANNSDRPTYNQSEGTDYGPLLLHIRQDLKLLVFVLGFIAIMLGIIADKIS
ncbi:hypothetical protein [Roseixanthobacter glucoisosaccharinicivorans]|uniref:hypothetical protein n=1 Tax=Roseixanthobacter glucoisosaccharinicivorans TaxID=3119923 RepID=UPI00372A87F8